jgi:hypothetical protein
MAESSHCALSPHLRSHGNRSGAISNIDTVKTEVNAVVTAKHADATVRVE